MLQKLKNFYENSVYQVCMFTANAVNKLLLTVIELKGLDPNSNPEQLRSARFREELNVAVDRGGKKPFCFYNRVSVPVKASKNDVPHVNAYKIQASYPKGYVPDYSDADDRHLVNEKERTIWKTMPKRPLKAYEIYNKQVDQENADYCEKTYTPATESTQPPIAAEASVAVDQGDIFTVEDQKFFKALDEAINDSKGPEVIDSLKQAVTSIVEKKTFKKAPKKSGKKTTKKTTKKAAKNKK